MQIINIMESVHNQKERLQAVVHVQPATFTAGESLEYGSKSPFKNFISDQQPTGPLISQSTGVFKETSINGQKCITSLIGG